MGRKFISKTVALVLVMVMVGTLISITPFKVKADEEANAIIVTTQKALMKELAKKSASTILFESEAVETLTIKSKVAKTIKRAKNKKVIIDAPNAKVNNYLKFKTFTIKNAKSVSERVNGNKVTVQSATTEFSVYKNSTVKKLTIPEYTQVKLGKKAKITTIKYTKTKPVVTTTPTATPKVTEAPTTTPVPTEQPTPVVVPTQAPVVTTAPTQAPVITEVPTQTPTVTEAPTTKPTTTEVPTQTITAEPTPTKPGDNYYWDEDLGEWISFTNTLPYWWGPNGHAYMVYWDNGQYNNGTANFKAMTDYGTGEVTISESEIIYPANWVKPEGWGVPYNPIITTTVTPEPTVTATTTPEPTVTEIVTPEPTVTAEPVPTEHEHQFTCTHFKDFKVKELHEAEYDSVSISYCNCGCNFYTIIDNADGTQSIEYWTREERSAHSAIHSANNEPTNTGSTRINIISKAAYYTEEIRNLCVCDICGTVQSYGDHYIIICEVD